MFVETKYITSEKIIWDLVIENYTHSWGSIKPKRRKFNKINNNPCRNMFERWVDPYGSEMLFNGKDFALDFRVW